MRARYAAVIVVPVVVAVAWKRRRATLPDMTAAETAGPLDEVLDQAEALDAELLEDEASVLLEDEDETLIQAASRGPDSE